MSSSKSKSDAEYVATTKRLRHQTIPGLLAARARDEPDGIAYRVKQKGIYRERRWADFRDQVAHCAYGFRGLGLRSGERVAIMGDCCEEWTIADLAVQSLGGISYGIYPTAAVPEVKYHMEHGGAVLLVAENQEHVDKILPIIDDLPDLRWVVVIDTTALFSYEHPKIIAFDKVVAEGTAESASPGAYDDLVADVTAEQPAFIVYTSGTTGNPKGAVITHGRHLAAAYTFITHYPTLLDGHHHMVAFLPLGHIMGRVSAITIPLLGSMIPHYGEDPEDIRSSFFEVAPTFIFTVPRYMQKFASNVLVQIENSSRLKRFVYHHASAWGRGYIQRLWNGKLKPWDGAIRALVHLLVFRPILNKLGFDQLQLVISAGAAAGRELTALWQIWGLNLVEVYGQTETAGAHVAGQKGPFPRPGNVGVPPLGWDVHLGPDNEILVRSPDLFNGYWNNEAATNEVVDADGWLHTGDVGQWEDGHLKIVDRARDIIVTSGGKTLSPTYIENEIRASPYISEAIVFGDNEKYLTALIEIDYDALSDWANRNGVIFSGFAGLVNNDKVNEFIKSEISAANNNLSRVEQIKVFRIIPKTLDPEEDGEPVTATRKIKRKQMSELYNELIASMYGHDEDRRLRSEVGDVFQAGQGG